MNLESEDFSEYMSSLRKSPFFKDSSTDSMQKLLLLIDRIPLRSASMVKRKVLKPGFSSN
jgi:hypothetical protein